MRQRNKTLLKTQVKSPLIFCFELFAIYVTQIFHNLKISRIIFSWISNEHVLENRAIDTLFNSMSRVNDVLCSDIWTIMFKCPGLLTFYSNHIKMLRK